MVGATLRNKGAEDSYNMLRALRGEIPTTPIREAVMPYAKEFSLRKDHYKIDLPRSNDRGRPSQGREMLYGLKSDPSEATDAWDNHPAVIRELTRLREKYHDDGRSVPLR
jgi:hypothetical protein